MSTAPILRPSNLATQFTAYIASVYTRYNRLDISTAIVTADGNGQSLRLVNFFSQLNIIMAGSLYQLCYRLIDIILLSLSLYYNRGHSNIPNSLMYTSFWLLVFNAIDLAFVLFLLAKHWTLGNPTLTNQEREARFWPKVKVRGNWLFYKLLITCVGTGYAFASTVPKNNNYEFVRFCLGIVCFSTWAQVFMQTPKPALPARRSSIVEYSILLLTIAGNGVYFLFVALAMRKTQNPPACIYTQIEDLYLRAPLKSFAYFGLILIGCKTVMDLLTVTVNRLFFRLPSWRTALVRLLAVHYVLSYFLILSMVYYFSVGAVLLFQPRSGGSCRKVAQDLYKTLLIWQWVRVFWPLIVFPLVCLLLCVGMAFGKVLASCLPASIAVPIIERLQEWSPDVRPEVIPPTPVLNMPNPPATPGTIDAMPMIAFGQESDPFEQTECAICQANFETDEQVKKLQCGHFFHARCVDTWLSITRICPVCRQRMISTHL